MPDIWTAGGKTYANLIVWVHEHFLTFLACNYPSNSQSSVYIKIGFFVDSKCGQNVQYCENPTNRAARGKIFLTLAVYTLLYLGPKNHENNSPTHEITSIFKNRQIMPNFTCKVFGLQNLNMPISTRPDRWMGITFTLRRHAASSLLQHSTQLSGSLLGGLTTFPVFLVLVSDWSSRR